MFIDGKLRTRNSKSRAVRGPEGQVTLTCQLCGAHADVSLESAKIIANLLDEHPELTIKRVFPERHVSDARDDCEALTMTMLNSILSSMPKVRKVVH